MKEKLTEEMKLVKEKETKMKIELDQLRVENKWLINEKKGKDGKENDKEEMERLRRENKDEKEKVTNLNTWKSQLAEKNKELKEENNR